MAFGRIQHEMDGIPERERERLNISVKSRQIIFEKADHNLQISAEGELIKLIKSLIL
jgi:hypothetical protein